MPICIECRYPVPQLYTTYSKADDRTLGRGVRLTVCPRCKKFADKYVEHDFVVLFIDLVLIKPRVYRHVLFNRLGGDKDGFHPTVLRLGVLLLLFDVYLTWAAVEKETSDPAGAQAGFSLFSWLVAALNLSSAVAPGASPGSILTYPIPLQYSFFLALCALETLAFHLPIRMLYRFAIAPLKHTATSAAPSATAAAAAATAPALPHPTRISTAILVSSCSKLFPILLVIWDYDLPSSASAVSWAVIINNVAALHIALGCGHARAALLVAAGAACRNLVRGAVLAAAGLGAGRTGAVEALGAEAGRWVGFL